MIAHNTPVKEIMSSPVITLGPRDTMDKVKRIFDQNSIHHIPVVEEGKVVGIISKHDLFKVLHGFTLFKSQQSDLHNQAILRSLLVGEVMTRQVAVLNEQDTLLMAAGFFRENYFHALPIIDDEGKLSGILTTYDLITHAYKDVPVSA